MAVTVVGSVAFDALETPFGKRERILGGAATHFSLAASFFTDVRVVGVVGEDFGEAELSHLNLYDRTVEGLVLKDVPGCTVQYHPEAGPGPHDARYLFDQFDALMDGGLP